MNQSRTPDPLYAGPRHRAGFDSRNTPTSPPSARPEQRQTDNMESNQSRAARYEDEKRRIIESCFAKKEDDGVLTESYITHVRVTEDAMFPSAPPPPDAAPANKKNRVILVAVRKSGRVRVHKGRENPSGSFSIGKTWALDELTAIHIFTGAVPRNSREQLEQQWAGDIGFVVTLGKPYYWQAPTAKEKDFFIASLIKIYRKYTGGKIPELTGFLPHQIDQLTGGQTPKATPEPATRSPLPLQPLSSPSQPPVIGGNRNLQSPSSGPLRAERPNIPPPNRDDGRSASRDDPRPTMPEPLRSPSRGDWVTPGQDFQRNQRTPDVPASQISSLDPGPSPALNRFQPTQTKGASLTPESSQVSLTQTERSGTPSSKGLNGLSPAPRIPLEITKTSAQVPPNKVALRDRTGSSTKLDEQRGPDSMEPQPADSRTTSSPASHQDRRRPYMGQTEMSSSQKSLTASENSRFATPATTPNAVRSETAKSTVTSESRPEMPKDILPPKDYFETAPKSIEREPIGDQLANQETKPAEVLTPLSSTSVVNEDKEGENESGSPPKTTEEEFRPGLGPMVKKRTAKDVASQFRKAAFAATAFKPREGGAAARLKALQDKENKSNEPDGITGVVPAPLLRGMSSDSVRPDTPQTVENDAIATPLTSTFTSKLQLQRSATEESLKAPEPQAKSKSEKPKVQPGVEITSSETEQRAPSPDKARSRSPRRRKRQRQEADIEKYCSSLGVDPQLFEGRGADFNDLLTEFGWEGKLKDQQKMDEFEVDVRREIGRAQATGWLGHVEQQEGKVQELAKAFDKAIEECEELDGLFTLYSHELDTLAADIEYIEAQSQGLQVQTANQKLLHKELQNLLTTLSIPSEDLRDLQYSPLDKPSGIAAIEQALALLFRALSTIDPDMGQNRAKRRDGANPDTGGGGVYADNTEVGQMRAVREKKDEYREETQSFLRRFNLHITTLFKHIEQRHSEDNSRSAASTSTISLDTTSHQSSRQELWLYNAMMLFVRDVNRYEWQTLIQRYEMNIKSTYQDQFRDNAMTARRGIRKPVGEEQELLFTHQEKDRSEDSLATTAARKLTVRRGKTVKTTAVRSGVNGERGDGKLEAWEAFQHVLQQQSKVVSEEQNFIVSFFHLNSLSNVDFSELVTSTTPEDRRLPNLNAKQSYDPDRENAKIVQEVIGGIYSFWSQDLLNFLEWVLSLDQLQGVGVLCAIEQTLSIYEETNQEYITRTLRTLHDKLVGLFHKFVDEQIRSIEETKVKLKKRKGIISFVRTFPSFSVAIESMMPTDSFSHESLEVRFIVNEAYSKILKATWESLSFIAKDDPATGGTAPSSAPAGGDPEDKEALNYHVLLIENMSHFLEEVEPHRNLVLEEWTEKAKHDMYSHLSQYTDAVIRRPLGKWLDFIESTEAMMKSNDSVQTIANRPSHSRSAAKKILKSYDAVEVRKGVETLKKRIEKHFGDVDDPMVTSKGLISKACEECNARYAHAHDRMKLIIDKIYDGSLEIDWRKEEVAAAFKR